MAAVACFIHQHVGQALECPGSPTGARQQLYRQVDGRRPASAGYATALNAVELIAQHLQMRKRRTELGFMPPVNHHVVPVQQATGRQQKRSIIDTHQLDASLGSPFQHPLVARCQFSGCHGIATTEQHQVVVLGHIELFGDGLNLHHGATAGGHRVEGQPCQGPAAIALSAVVFVIGAETQLVEKRPKRQQGEFRQRQDQQADIRGHLRASSSNHQMSRYYPLKTASWPRLAHCESTRYIPWHSTPGSSICWPASACR
ncbi:hypothetical protein D3C81_1166200 [compost metagenome]